jgi:hypothetical protein
MLCVKHILTCERAKNMGLFTHVFVRDVRRNGIPRVCSYFCSTERSSEFICLPRSNLEQTSKCLLLVLFHGLGIPSSFSSAEWFRTEFREFSVLRNSRNSAGTNQLLRLLRLPRNNFLLEIATLVKSFKKTLTHAYCPMSNVTWIPVAKTQRRH